MMLAEVRGLLAAVPGPATYDDYAWAAIEDNALGKATAATRVKTLGMLRQLYALDGSVPVFAALRALWALDAEAQRLIALLCAVARDPLLRATADFVLALQPGDPVGPAGLGAEVGAAFPARYSPGVLHHLGQNTGASWVQAGHLTGRMKKHRARAMATTPATVYALYLGHLEGLAGPALYGTLWARLLDTDQKTLQSQVKAAARSGWIDYASAGGMTEFGFSPLDELTHRGSA